MDAGEQNVVFDSHLWGEGVDVNRQRKSGGLTAR